MTQERTTLQGKVVIITGGSVGIGRAAALCLAQLGAAVVVVSRNAQRIELARDWLLQQVQGAEILGLALDVSKKADMQEMVDRTLQSFGRIDVLIASAGVLRAVEGELRTVAQMSSAEWDQILDINLKGTYLSNHAAIPVMMKQGSGQIINVSSTSGRKGYAFDSAYCASKFAVIGMSESLAEELRPHGIRVQVLLPGVIDTPMWSQNGPVPKPADVLPVERVAAVLSHMVRLPSDAVCLETVVEPLRVHGRPAWIG